MSLYTVLVNGSSITAELVKVECVANKPCIAVFNTTEEVSQGDVVRIDVVYGTVGNTSTVTVFSGYVYRVVDKTRSLGKLYEVNAVSRLDALYHGYIDKSFNETLDSFMNNLLNASPPYINDGSPIDGLTYFRNDELTSYVVAGKYYGNMAQFFNALYESSNLVVLTIPNGSNEYVTISSRGRHAYNVVEKIDVITEVGGSTGVDVYNCLKVKAWSIVEQYVENIDASDNNGHIQLSAIPVGEVKVYVTDSNYTPQYELCRDYDFWINFEDDETPPTIQLDSKYASEYLQITYWGRKLYKKKYVASASVAIPDRCKAVVLKDVDTAENLASTVDDYANKWLSTHTETRERHIFQPVVVNNKIYPLLENRVMIYSGGTQYYFRGLFNLTLRRYLDASQTSYEDLYVKRIKLTPRGIEIDALPYTAYARYEDALSKIGVRLTALEVTAMEPGTTYTSSVSALKPI